MYRITNRVYSADAYPVGDLHLFRCSGYKPPTAKFGAGILRTKIGTVLIYSTGRAVINKCRTRKDMKKTVVLCATELGVLLHNVKLVHVAGSGNLGTRVDLYKMSKIVPKGLYEPDLHPGLHYYIANVSVYVFHTGKVMFVGSRSICQFKYSIHYIDLMLRRYSDKYFKIQNN